MPWSPKDSTRFTKKARSPVAKRQWSHVADSALARGLSDKEAVIEANGVIKRRGSTAKQRTGKVLTRKGR